MQYVRIYATDEDDSRFEQIDMAGEPTRVIDGVPPLLVSGPFPVSAALFVEQRKAAAEWRAHVAPKRQWLVILPGLGSGRLAGLSRPPLPRFEWLRGLLRRMGGGPVLPRREIRSALPCPIPGDR